MGGGQYLSLPSTRQDLTPGQRLQSSDYKIKESEKKDEYLDLARELRKLLNWRVAVIPIITGSLGKLPEGLERG